MPGLNSRLFLLPALLAMGCGQGSTEPAPTGAIEVTVLTTTSIGEVDTEHYLITVDNNPAHRIGAPTVFRISGLTKGPHSVRLSGLPGNCLVTHQNPLLIDLDPTLGTLLLTFSVNCGPLTDSPWDY